MAQANTDNSTSMPIDHTRRRFEATIKASLAEIRCRLDKAAGRGRAADACAEAGLHEKGLEVALDIEQLLYEATTLLNAASLINRIARQS
jgi:hypothetical protein